MVPLQTPNSSEKVFKRSPKPKQQTPAHRDLAARLSKTLYYGNDPAAVGKRFSMPLADLGVEFYRKATKKRLGGVDLEYASQVAWETRASPCALMMSFVYVNRLKRTQPDYLDQMGSADLFLISLMMASKYLCDEGVDEEVYNDEWADSGYVRTDRINDMEGDFLNAMDWSLYIGSSEFASMRHMVEARIAMREGLDRGWFTYTDMDILTEDITMAALYKHLLALNKMLMMLAVAAATCYVTIASAALLSLLSTTITLRALSLSYSTAASLSHTLSIPGLLTPYLPLYSSLSSSNAHSSLATSFTTMCGCQGDNDGVGCFRHDNGACTSGSLGLDCKVECCPCGNGTESLIFNGTSPAVGNERPVVNKSSDLTRDFGVFGAYRGNANQIPGCLQSCSDNVGKVDQYFGEIRIGFLTNVPQLFQIGRVTE